MPKEKVYATDNRETIESNDVRNPSLTVGWDKGASELRVSLYSESVNLNANQVDRLVELLKRVRGQMAKKTVILGSSSKDALRVADSVSDHITDGHLITNPHDVYSVEGFALKTVLVSEHVPEDTPVYQALMQNARKSPGTVHWIVGL